jgi:hypothetical protein
MSGVFAKKLEQIPIPQLFPDSSPDRQRALQDTLDAYCELLLRIFERLEHERENDFDGGRRSS